MFVRLAIRDFNIETGNIGEEIKQEFTIEPVWPGPHHQHTPPHPRPSWARMTDRLGWELKQMALPAHCFLVIIRQPNQIYCELPVHSSGNTEAKLSKWCYHANLVILQKTFSLTVSRKMNITDRILARVEMCCSVPNTQLPWIISIQNK